jgi:hypothetical protein
VLRRIGRGDDHLAALDRAIALGEGDPVFTARAVWRRARGCQALGRFDEAEASYRECAQLGQARAATAIGGVAEVRALARSGPGGLAPARYRRYGLTPTAWITGRTLRARLRFATVPDASARAAIARAAHAAARPWFELDEPDCLWSDAFAVIRLRSIDDEPAFGGLATVIEAIHHVAPLVEAVGWNAIGVNAADAAELWSIATQPVPDAGPDFSGRVGFWVPALADTRAFARPHHDADFDDAWREAEDADARAVAEARVAASAHDAVMLAPVDELPEPVELPAAIAAQLRDDYDIVRLGASGDGVILRHRQGYYVALDRVSATGDVRTVVPDDTVGHLEAVSTDGHAAVYATAEAVTWVDLRTGIRGELLHVRDGGRVESTAFLADGCVLVRFHDALVVVDPARGEVARAVVRPGPIAVWRGRLVLCAAGVSPELVV